jgi:hypothetical protein
MVHASNQHRIRPPIQPPALLNRQNSPPGDGNQWLSPTRVKVSVLHFALGKVTIME